MILADFPWSFFNQGAIGRGGGQSCTWLTQLAEEFSKQDTSEIHWVTINHENIKQKTKTKKWGGQYFHMIRGLKRSLDLRLGLRFSRWTLLRIIRKIKPSVVHCWGTETAYPSVCGHCNVPVILSMQGILSEYSRIGSLPDMYYWNELARREPEYLKHATVVTSESQWGINRIRESALHIDVRQVEYGVNSSFYQIFWQPATKQPYALFSGSIDHRKGVDTLLDAWKLITQDGIALRIAGDGPLFKELKDRNMPNVEWLGLLNWQQMQQQLAGATCLILPTKADTSPNVVKEARVVGLPVITTLHGGQAGYIKDGENGIIVNPLEPIGLAKALSRLMENPALAKQMGACRHEEDRAYFRPENTAKGFLNIYDELLGNTDRKSR